MKVAVFSVKQFDRKYMTRENTGHELTFYESRLTVETARLAEGHGAVCPFVNDDVSETVLEVLFEAGVRLIVLRSAGFNNVDLAAADRLGIAVARVPAYSPHAVAEHTVALMLAVNRKLPHAFNRVREGNFELNGLLGFDMNGRTAGVIGTGKIGRVVAKILAGLGCRVLAHDPFPSSEFTGTYVDLPTLFQESDIVTLHSPLTSETHHLIDARALALMKKGVMLVNTSRGALVDTRAVIEGLKSGHVGYLALDVYEEEADLFFEDLSSQVIQDDVFARLLTFPNVLITGHQAFFTEEALTQISRTTMLNLTEFEAGKPLTNVVRAGS